MDELEIQWQEDMDESGADEDFNDWLVSVMKQRADMLKND